jgi:hypothetical protein
VQDNQQTLKGVVSFYYTHKIIPTCFGSQLPSSGGYTFLVSCSSIVCASGGCGLWFARCGQPSWNAHSTAASHTERRWQLVAETCRGNLMSIIKAYNTLEHLLVILHRKIQKCSLHQSRWTVVLKWMFSVHDGVALTGFI